MSPTHPTEHPFHDAVIVGAGVAGLFMETHPDPDNALCDGPNSWPLGLMGELLETLVEIDRLVKNKGFAEDKLKGSQP